MTLPKQKQSWKTNHLPVSSKIEQVDSIMIDVINEISIYDYNPKTGLFLGGDVSQENYVRMGVKTNELGYLIINQQGEILYQFNRANNGPEGYGYWIGNSFFFGDEYVGVLNGKGLFKYSMDGDLIWKNADINTLYRRGYLHKRAILADEDDNVIAFMDKDTISNRDMYYQLVKPLFFYLPDSSGRLTVSNSYGYPDHEIYNPEKEYFKSGSSASITYNYAQRSAHVVYPNVPRMYSYDLSSGAYLGMTDLNPEYFSEPVLMGESPGAIEGYGGLFWINKGGRFSSSTYNDVLELGEYTLTTYNSGISNENLNKILTSDKYHHHPDWPTIRRTEYRFYYQLFKGGKKVVPDFQLPIFDPKLGERGFNSGMIKGELVGGDGLDRIYVLVPNEEEVERDYQLIRVYKVTLLE